MSFIDEHKDRTDGGRRWGGESICRVLCQQGITRAVHLLLHETQCPLGAPVPTEGDTVGFNGSLYDVMGVAFEYGLSGEPPMVILRVDDF